MTTRSISTAAFLEELSQNPYWRNPGKLEGRSIVLIEDTQKPLCFHLQFQLDGATLLAPFWIDSSLHKWCFQNGNPHAFQHLSDMIPEILHHLEKGEALLHKDESI